MANGLQGGGAVSPGTHMQARGAQQMERGLARILSAGADPTTKAAYMASAERRGQEAAQQIRMRYFKKEFEQVLKLEVNPITDRLRSEHANMVDRLKTSVMPVPVIKTPEEIAQRQEQLNMTDEVFNTIQTGTTAEGKPQVEVQRTETPAPNVGFQGDSLGAVESKEQLSFIDQLTGKPIPVDSPAGVALMQNEHSESGVRNTGAQTSIMDIYAKYGGNPYANKALSAMMENLEKQSSRTATGMADPAEAQKFMEGREKFDQEQEEAELREQQMQMDNEKMMGNRNALVESARTLVMNGRTPTGIGDKLADKLRNAEELTPLQAATVAQAQELYLDQVNKNAAAGLKNVGIKPVNYDNPEYWQGDYMTGTSPISKEYKINYKFSMEDSIGKEVTAFRNSGEAAQQAYFRRKGIPDDEIKNWNSQGEIPDDSALHIALSDDAAAKGSRARANGIAMIAILEKQEHENNRLGNGEVTATVDRALNEWEAELRIKNAKRDHPLTDASLQSEIDYKRKHRAHTFVKHVYGVNIERDEPYRGKVEYRMDKVSPGLGIAEAPVAAAVAPASEEVTGPLRTPRLIPGTDTPDRRPVTKLTEWERVHGRGSVNPMKGAVKRFVDMFPDKAPNEQHTADIPHINMRDSVTGPDGRQQFASSTYASLDSTMLKTLLEQPSLTPETRAEIELALSLRLPLLDSFDAPQEVAEGVTAEGSRDPVAQTGERVHWNDHRRGR